MAHMDIMNCFQEKCRPCNRETVGIIHKIRTAPQLLQKKVNIPFFGESSPRGDKSPQFNSVIIAQCFGKHKYFLESGALEIASIFWIAPPPRVLSKSVPSRQLGTLLWFT